MFNVFGIIVDLYEGNIINTVQFGGKRSKNKPILTNKE